MSLSIEKNATPDNRYRVLVTGTRHGVAEPLLAFELGRLAPDVVIEGGAGGVDHQAARWARERHIDVDEYRADWGRYGKAAGPIRNQTMLDQGRPDLVLAFPGTDSVGTWDMVRRAERAGVPVRVVEANRSEVAS